MKLVNMEIYPENIQSDRPYGVSGLTVSEIKAAAIEMAAKVNNQRILPRVKKLSK